MNSWKTYCGNCGKGFWFDFVADRHLQKCIKEKSYV